MTTLEKAQIEHAKSLQTYCNCQDGCDYCIFQVFDIDKDCEDCLIEFPYSWYLNELIK